MTDVVQKVVNTRDIRSAWMVTDVTLNGKYRSVPPLASGAQCDVPDPSGIRAILATRFDDPTYYTA